MTFIQFLTTKYPLYADGEMRVNLTVNELDKIYTEYLSKHQPILTVEMHEPKFTQINHLSTKF